MSLVIFRYSKILLQLVPCEAAEGSIFSFSQSCSTDTGIKRMSDVVLIIYPRSHGT